jgi:sugar phosphate isomerase/epimerase
LLPGDGNIDVQGLFDALPADLPVSVEVVNFGREANTSVHDWAAECLTKSRPFVQA